MAGPVDLFEGIARDATLTNGNARVADSSPPFEPLDRGGLDVTTTSQQLVIRRPARARLRIQHAGDPEAPRVWLGFDTAAVAGAGDFLNSSGCFEDFVICSVHVVHDGDPDEVVRVTYTEWAT
jgi:hypothetical protein